MGLVLNVNEGKGKAIKFFGLIRLFISNCYELVKFEYFAIIMDTPY
jgi:hypothetical protein